MIRALSVAALVAALPAWAVGENIQVTGPAREQLSETLCISMDCVKSGGDYTVSSKVVGSQMELKVLGPSGPRLSLSLPLNGAGRLANSDAMTATSQLVQAIENPKAAAAAAAAASAAEKPKPTKAALKAKASKSAKSSKLAKAGKKSNPVRVAARKLSRG